MPSVSVIIPMYNAEKYIEQCLQSLLSQTLKNFEVIVVDDCSTDKSFAIVEKLSKNFIGNKKLILGKTSQNTGWSSLPRNFALDMAEGKYVTFMDNDDFMEPTALEELYKLAEEFNADVVHPEKCIMQLESNGQLSKRIDSIQKSNFVDKPTLETSDISERIAKFINRQTHWWIWNKLYRRKFLVENNLKFPPMQTFEDMVFSFYCIILAKNYVRVPNLVYNWRVRSDSHSHKGVDGVTLVRRATDVMKYLDDFMSRQKYFLDNPSERFSVLDFFMQERFQKFGEGMFVKFKATPGEIYDILNKELFMKKFPDTAAMTSFLFVASSLYKSFSDAQTKKIAYLETQLAKLQN